MNFIVYCCRCRRRRFSLLLLVIAFCWKKSKSKHISWRKTTTTTTYKSIVIACICAFLLWNSRFQFMMIQWQVHAELISFLFAACARVFVSTHTCSKLANPKAQNCGAVVAVVVVLVMMESVRNKMLLSFIYEHRLQLCDHLHTKSIINW